MALNPPSDHPPHPPAPLLAGCGLPAAWAGQRQWCVVATAFGAGQDFLATWAAWRADARQQRPRLLHFVACTAAAPAVDAAAAPPHLAPLARQLAAQCWGLLPGVHRLAFEDGQVLLTLLVGDAPALLRQQQPPADSIYLGECAPDPDPGSAVHLLKALARCCRRGTRLACTGAPHGLHAALAGCGFALHAAPGAPASVQATFDPPWQPRAARPVLAPAALPAGAAPGSCLVVGAGLAGSAVAASLARRGWRVTVLDAAAPAAGASGLPAGVFSSHVSPDDSLLSRLSRAGVRTTLAVLASLPADARGRDWLDGGVLEHDPDAPLRLAWTQGAGLDWSRPATPGELHASHLPASAAPHTCWHARGGWVRPSQLVRALLAQPGIAWRGGAAVARLVRAGGSWRALDASGALLAEAGLAVVCAGPASAALAGAPLPLQLLRGQIAWGRHADATASAPWPAQPVNGHGNLVPRVPLPATPDAADGAGTAPGWVLGSTFERDCGELPVPPADRLAGRAANLAKLRALQPALGTALAPAFAPDAAAGTAVQTWAAVRCAAPDRLPLVGPVDAQALPGLWVSTAMGARGLTLALLCAELLAARLHGEPLPLEARLAQALGCERLHLAPA